MKNNNIEDVLSKISQNDNNGALVGRLLTEVEIDTVSGAGEGNCSGSGYTQSGGSFTQNGGHYTQSGSDQPYDMTCTLN